ncbi:MAG: hypothetical protein JKX72_06270 [Robiginitomaculum sp.]|nr:hypothetical protein [Robiginitomaculum sp.]
MQNLFNADFMEACGKRVINSPVPLTQDEIGSYLISLDDGLTKDLIGQYPDVSIVASITGRGLIVTADEDRAKKHDSFYARYEISGGEAHYKSSGVVT